MGTGVGSGNLNRTPGAAERWKDDETDFTLARNGQLAVMTLSSCRGRAGRRGKDTALTVRNRRSRLFLFSVTRDSDFIAR
ncbi:hypothetical protein EVAR_29210_1 [Eumeta japonica]|uniref:Uncharacterized protein n=1 Tax=Eumeta variegata TaxID=151549 RepID=A0A4C1VIZ3_EUMVA|nr:hypothetical protein EVAR_29210_1 [Eumeta japonica]